jgi:hypothetical protein
MAQVEIGASVNIEFQSVGNLRQQLRQANEELIRMQQEFGAASDEAIAAAQRVAEMRDQIDEARQASELFDPGEQFKAFVDIGSKIASGFAAVQGAMSLIGVESEGVEKALLKVQSAMALAQGLSDLKDFGEAWDNMKIFINAATQGVSGFKKALISSGIGALVVAVGTLVAYWDDIKGLVNGVSKEQEKLTEQTEKNLTAEQEKMDALKSSEEILKLQGKSEREILKLKIEQIKPVIVESKARIKNAEDNKILQIAAAKRNNEFTKMAVRGWIEGATAILRALAAPVDLILVTANKVSEVLGFGKITATTINEEITKMNVAASDWVANQIFDPEKVRIESEESIKTMKKTLLQQENEYAGYQNQLNGANNKGNKDRSEANEKAANDRLEALRIAEEARLSLLSEKNRELEILEKNRIEESKKLELGGIKEGSEQRLKFDESYRIKKQEIIDKYDKEEKEREKEFQNQINELKKRLNSNFALSEQEEAKQAVIDKYAKEREELLNQYPNNLALMVLLKQNEDAELSNIDKSFEEKRRQQRNENNRLRIESEKAFAAELLAVETELQNQKYNVVNGGLDLLQQLSGKNEKIANVFFAIQKAIEIGRIITSTASSIALVKAQTAAIPAILPPGIPNPAYFTAVALNAKRIASLKIGAGVSIAQIAAASISKFKSGGQSPSGGGQNEPPPPGTAPMQPGLSPAVQGQALNAQAINDLGNQSLRAYVMNSDIQNNNQRNAYLERNARIG